MYKITHPGSKPTIAHYFHYTVWKEISYVRFLSGLLVFVYTFFLIQKHNKILKIIWNHLTVSIFYQVKNNR